MKIERLDLANLRIYDRATITFQHNTAVLLGDNAQGKTSILEAIHLLAFTKSHKTNREIDVIRNTADFARIHAVVAFEDKEGTMDIILSKQGKKAKYNEIEMVRLSEYVGRLNVVMFAPEDLDLIKGTPSDRRNFLDTELGQMSRSYLQALQQYKRILKQRNDLLKSMQKQQQHDLLLLDVITEQLVDYQEPITHQRTVFLRDVETAAQEHYRTLADRDDTLTITYLPSMLGNPSSEHQNRYQYDIITGTTNMGAHRDDIELQLNNQPLKTHGSQGEQRTAVLAIKLALIDVIHARKQAYPVLLLDDVLSELDERRQNNLLSYINRDIQTIITTTSINDIHLDAMDDVALYHIDQGQIKECDRHARPTT
jgi:DNA replication and repair protein RecF